MKRLCLNFLFFFLIPSSLMADPVASSSESANPSSTQETMEFTHCPAVETLMYDQKSKLWGIGDWVSQEPSYDKRIVSFQAAQWVGANMGTMICVYKSDNPTSFPVTIQNTTLVPAPTGSSWGQYKNGRKNCPPYQSDSPMDVNDCPFYMPKKQTVPKDIYEQLDFFKNKKKPAQ